MKYVEDIADPTDWAETPVAELQPVESSLRCQVCKEFFDTPVITSCAHTFCSLCIRRCLSHDGKCPTCRAQDQPIRLRRNWVVEELVSAFAKARPKILQMGRDISVFKKSEPIQPLKRKLEDISVNFEANGRQSRRKTRLQSRREQGSNSPSTYSHSESGENSLTEDLEKEDDGKVECPICQSRMKEEEVSPHIDRVHSGAASSPKLSASIFGLMPENRSSTQSAVIHERTSQLNYSLLSDTALRKKLGSLGIPSNGNKQLMIRRHKEWVDLYNANCDSAKPRTKRELLRELDNWERTQGGLTRGNEDTNGIMSKDFDGASWAQKNGPEFRDLITQARARKSEHLSSSQIPRASTISDRPLSQVQKQKDQTRDQTDFTNEADLS